MKKAMVTRYRIFKKKANTSKVLNSYLICCYRISENFSETSMYKKMSN